MNTKLLKITPYYMIPRIKRLCNPWNALNGVSMANRKGENCVSVNQNLPNKLLSCLYSQRRTGRFCDVVLIVGGVKFSVHSCVLASFSSYFNDIFMSTSKGMPGYSDFEHNKINHINTTIQKDNLEHWSLRNPLHLNLPPLDPGYGRGTVDCSDCTAKVLDFMYLGKIQIQKEHVDHIRSISTVLDVSELLLICDKYNEKYALQTKRKPEVQSKQQFHKKSKKDAVYTDVQHGVNVVNNDETRFTEEAVNNQKGGETSDGRNNELESETVALSETGNVDDSVSVVGNTAASEKEVDSSISSSNVDNSTSPDPYMCHICELKFSSSILLRQHRETHLGRLNTCYACRYSSYKAFELIKHLLEADHQEIVCSLCLFEAENPAKLKDHLKQHNHPKPFFCTICNVRFQTRALLNTHTPKHSTEMPFSCSLCNRAFKWKQGLQNHMAVHTPEKKHLCSECGFSTAYQSTFRAHTLVHTSNMFICPHAECNFKSARKQNVMSHLMTHNKEKPYQCEVCGQSYSQSKNLRRHAVKHDAVAEEFLERCPLCLYQTMRLDKLKIHFRKHHPDSDEKLLSLQRRKHRMHTLTRVNHPDINVSENLKQVPEPVSASDCVVKHSEPFNMERQQLQEVQSTNSRRENKASEGNMIIANGLKLLQEGTNGNATFIVTDLNTRLTQLVTSRDMDEALLHSFQRDPLLVNEGGAVILLDNLNPLFVPMNEKCSLAPLTFNSVNNIQVPEVVNVKQSDSVQTGSERANQVVSEPLKTIKVDNRIQEQEIFRREILPVSHSINPKLSLVGDDAQNTSLHTTGTECILKSSKICDSKLGSGESFTVMLSNSNDSRIQQLTAIVDGFNRGEIPLGGPYDSSTLNTTVGNLINEQLQALTNHKEDSTLDVLNNNVIQELFADDGTGAELDVLSKDVVQGLVLNEDSTNTLDILSKDVPQVTGSEETLSVVLDNSNKDKVLLCHETITDDTDNLQHMSSEGSQLQVHEDCDSPVLRTFQSFESILESLSLPDKI